MTSFYKGVLIVFIAWAATATAAASTCNQPLVQAPFYIATPGHPFSAIPSSDGCVVFVSLTSEDGTSHLAMLRRADGKLSLAQDIAALGHLTGMALSHDGHILAAANGVGATLFDTTRLISGRSDSVLGYLNDGPSAGSIYVAFSPDDQLLFVSNERSQSLSEYKFTTRGSSKKVEHLGQIPTGEAPVGLAFSHDGRLLYSTSEIVPNGESTCLGQDGGPNHPTGALLVIAVDRAEINPSNSVIARVRAGCEPVRVALSPANDIAYVTARGSNKLEVFDTTKLLGNPSNPSSEVTVGRSPVGVAVAGDTIFVANSDRFGSSMRQSISVIDAHNLSAPSRSIPAGGFPRELGLTADGRTLLVTNFETQSVELINLDDIRTAQGIR